MKRKSTLPITGAEVSPLVKTSITIPSVLMEFAETQLTQEGFNSMSAYLAELIRRDRRERERLQIKPAEPSSPPGQSALKTDADALTGSGLKKIRGHKTVAAK